MNEPKSFASRLLAVGANAKPAERVKLTGLHSRQPLEQ